MGEKKGLELLREPFPANLINSLPKPTKAQTDAIKKDYKSGIRCQICGGWHHPKVVHLEYVGHAALTDRLLDADPMWYWEPIAFTSDGLPAFDETGGLWIRLTVCGHSRIGYGHAEKSNFKEIGSREKEVIGDALRNAAMRFGAALDLWHKGDLHKPEKEEKAPPKTQPEEVHGTDIESPEIKYMEEIDKLPSADALSKWWAKNAGRINSEDDATVRKVSSYFSQIKAVFNKPIK